MTGPSWVLPYLSIGAQPTKRTQWDALKQSGVTLIIDLNDNGVERLQAESISLKYRGLEVPDGSTTTTDFLRAFRQVHKWIEGERKVGGKVYLHCTHGEYRSPTCAMAQIIATGVTLEEAIRKVKKSHPPTLTPANVGTANRALQLWQSQRLTRKEKTGKDQASLDDFDGSSLVLVFHEVSKSKKVSTTKTASLAQTVVLPGFTGTLAELLRHDMKQGTLDDYPSILYKYLTETEEIALENAEYLEGEKPTKTLTEIIFLPREEETFPEGPTKRDYGPVIEWWPNRETEKPDVAED